MIFHVTSWLVDWSNLMSSRLPLTAFQIFHFNLQGREQIQMFAELRCSWKCFRNSLQPRCLKAALATPVRCTTIGALAFQRFSVTPHSSDTGLRLVLDESTCLYPISSSSPDAQDEWIIHVSTTCLFPLMRLIAQSELTGSSDIYGEGSIVSCFSNVPEFWRKGQTQIFGHVVSLMLWCSTELLMNLCLAALAWTALNDAGTSTSSGALMAPAASMTSTSWIWRPGRWKKCGITKTEANWLIYMSHSCYDTSTIVKQLLQNIAWPLSSHKSHKLTPERPLHKVMLLNFRLEALAQDRSERRPAVMASRILFSNVLSRQADVIFGMIIVRYNHQEGFSQWYLNVLECIIAFHCHWVLSWSSR